MRRLNVPQAATDIRPHAQRTTAEPKDSSLSTGASSTCVVGTVWICGPSPERIDTFKRHHCLRDIGLGNWDASHGTGLGHQLNRGSVHVFGLMLREKYLGVLSCVLIDPTRENQYTSTSRGKKY